MSFSGKAPKHVKLDERNHVEKPLLDQLAGLGWEVIDLTDMKQTPADTHRESFSEVGLPERCLDEPRPERLDGPPVAGVILQPEADCRLIRGEGFCADLVLAAGGIADFLQEV